VITGGHGHFFVGASGLVQGGVGPSFALSLRPMRFLRIATLAALAGLWANCSDNTMGIPPAPPSIDGGAIFPNLTFDGIRSAATLDTPATVSMSEYQDPAGARYDLLHVVGLFMWCPHCNNETNNLASIAAWRTASRVAVVQIAMEGYGGESPTWSELQKWVSDHNVDFSVLIDSQGAQLGQYFPVDSVPVNIVVNPRTMEVLAVDIGEVGDCQAYEQGFLANL
jgi:hypothetical protein